MSRRSQFKKIGIEIDIDPKTFKAHDGKDHITTSLVTDNRKLSAFCSKMEELFEDKMASSFVREVVLWSAKFVRLNNTRRNLLSLVRGGLSSRGPVEWLIIVAKRRRHGGIRKHKRESSLLGTVPVVTRGGGRMQQ